MENVELTVEDSEGAKQQMVIKDVSTRMTDLVERSSRTKNSNDQLEAEFTRLLAEQLSRGVDTVKEAALADNALASKVDSVDWFFGSLEVEVSIEISGRIGKMTGREFLQKLQEPCSSADNFPSFSQEDLSKLSLSELIVFKRTLFSAREYGKGDTEGRPTGYTAQEYKDGLRIVAETAGGASITLREGGNVQPLDFGTPADLAGQYTAPTVKAK